MRFDDSLKTVLSADMATGFGAQSAWRQLVDLTGRGRAVADDATIARLRMLRPSVPASVRAASARALAFAAPDAALVGFFAEDELAIAAPVLRTATLAADDWIALLPRLSPALRSVLRHRRDLPAEVARGLASFGPIDFVIAGPVAPTPTPVVTEPDPTPVPVALPTAATEPVALLAPILPDAPLSESPFMALGEITRSLPVVAEALRHAEAAEAENATPLASPAPIPPSPVPTPNGFVISDIVARIEAFRQRRSDGLDEMPAPQPVPQGFRYETDATGAIVTVEGVSRTPLVGASIALSVMQGVMQVDGVTTGAFRRRSVFRDARLLVGGDSPAAGSWRLSGSPVFDDASGRFAGYRGTGRRPRADESAAPVRPVRSSASDSLRQLVHELRTPSNAIAGFAELIGTELLGPVPEVYRDRANLIRSQAAGLIAAIDDLDTAARIEVHALDLRTMVVPMQPLLARIVADLVPLADLRGAIVTLDSASDAVDVAGDDRAVERLLGRLLAAIVSAGSQGERITVAVALVDASAVVMVDRPRALGPHAADDLLSIDAEREADIEGAPLLGTGFALRLAQNLALELGGALTIGDDRLTLRLPAVATRTVEQASIV